MADDDTGRARAGYIRLNPDVSEDGAPGEISELAKRLRGDTGDAGRALVDLYSDTVGASKAASGALDHQTDSVIQGINDSFARHRDEQKRRDLEVQAAEEKRQAERAEDHALVQEQTDAIREQANLVRQQAESSKRSKNISLVAAVVSVIIAAATLVVTVTG